MSQTVFLDLDGTLTDSGPGIFASVRHALETLSLPVPEDLSWVIGPPLIDSFARLGAPDPAEALRIYRERYSRIGLLENDLYPGISEALDDMAGRYRLCLATAKPRIYAMRITAHFGLDARMTEQFGPELDGTRNDKGALLAYALDRLGLSAADCVMVGDRHNDIDAARRVGMASIGVGWGYAAPGELDAADARCARPEALPGAVAQLFG